MGEMRHECGVVGVFGYENAAFKAALAVHALQHRGEDACGIVTPSGYFHRRRFEGLVSDEMLGISSDLPGNSAIAHVRYTTTGEKDRWMIQPHYGGQPVIIAGGGNGDLINIQSLMAGLEKSSYIFQSLGPSGQKKPGYSIPNDMEVIAHYLARELQHYRHSAEEAVANLMTDVKGAYSAVCMQLDGTLWAFRDPLGIRPLVLGQGKENGSYIVASEETAFDMVRAEYQREVKPGELLIINRHGIRSIQCATCTRRAQCFFEHVYFSLPVLTFGKDGYEVRLALGRKLAQEAPVSGADVVIGVPDSALIHAQGYAEEHQLPMRFGLLRHHHAVRTFIQSTQSSRDTATLMKHMLSKGVLLGKKVILVDDSLIRGTTMRPLVRMLREAGAIEVHVRIASAPVKGSCFYGIATPTKEELIINRLSVDEIAKQIEADSLAYLSLSGMKLVIPDPENYCFACWDLNYPVKLD